MVYINNDIIMSKLIYKDNKKSVLDIIKMTDTYDKNELNDIYNYLKYKNEEMERNNLKKKFNLIKQYIYNSYIKHNIIKKYSE